MMYFKSYRHIRRYVVTISNHRVIRLDSCNVEIISMFFVFDMVQYFMIEFVSNCASDKNNNADG